jgi:hypothetical protein
MQEDIIDIIKLIVVFPQTALRTPLKTALNGGACSTSCFRYFPLVSIKQKADWLQR